MKAKSQIEAQCHWCGTVIVGPGDLRCALDPARQGVGLCEFACPICDRLAIVPSTQAGIEALSKEGAGELAGRVPFEMLEAHSGSALSWDDVLDLHLALEGTPAPQAELAR